MKQSRLRVGILLLSAATTVLLLDIVIGSLVPKVPHEYEASDGFRDFARDPPDVLVLGSSYARSLIPAAEAYEQRDPPMRFTIIPVEGGKFSVLSWILEHRIKPVLDDKPEAKPQHLLLQTNYYDICGDSGKQPNLPARAWNLGDYLRDLGRNGATTYNANYADRIWSGLMDWSSLVSDRGFFRIIPYLRQRVGAGAEEAAQESEELRLEAWVGMIEELDLDSGTCITGGQVDALDSILRFVDEEDIPTSVLLWATIPKAVTPETAAVADKFKAFIEKRVGDRPIRVFDLDDAEILKDEHFRPDLDHLWPEGDEIVSEWADEQLFQRLYREHRQAAGTQP